MDRKYLKGLYLGTRENQPDFVIGQLSFKMDNIEELVEQLKSITNAKGYANVDILKGDKGPYLKISTYGVEEERKPNF